MLRRLGSRSAPADRREAPSTVQGGQPQHQRRGRGHPRVRRRVVPLRHRYPLLVLPEPLASGRFVSCRSAVQHCAIKPLVACWEAEREVEARATCLLARRHWHDMRTPVLREKGGGVVAPGGYAHDLPDSPSPGSAIRRDRMAWASPENASWNDPARGSVRSLIPSVARRMQAPAGCTSQYGV